MNIKNILTFKKRSFHETSFSMRSDLSIQFEHDCRGKKSVNTILLQKIILPRIKRKFKRKTVTLTDLQVELQELTLVTIAQN